MPQTTYDPVAGIIAKSPASDSARADAWDAFHDAKDESELASKLRGMSLPDSVKADLWDLKATGHDPRTPVSGADFAPTSLPYKGQTMPGDTFAEKLRNAASVLGGEVVGGLKGAAHSALNVGQMAIDAGIVPGTTSSAFNPAFRNPILQRAEADTAYSDDPAQRFGGKLETAAELAAPALDVAKAGIGLAQAAPAARAIPAALGKSGTIAADIASHLPVVGRPIRLLRTVLDLAASKEAPAAANAGGRLVKDAADRTPALERELADALDALRKPDLPQSVELPPQAELPPGYTPRTDAPAPVAVAPSPNAGGRVVPPQEPTLTQAISDALAQSRTPEPPARITTPPAPTLPPGYTPRATVPKPKAVKMAAPEPAPEPVAPAPAAPRARAYFLKSAEDIADARAAKAAHDAAKAAPKGSITVAYLPSAWQSRVGQDIFPTTGAEGKDVLDAFRQEMKQRGMSPGEAIALVSKNKSLPVAVRSQLLRALNKAGS